MQSLVIEPHFRCIISVWAEERAGLSEPFDLAIPFLWLTFKLGKLEAGEAGQLLILFGR